MRPAAMEVKIKETHKYVLDCPACREISEISTSVLKVFIGCPICGLTFRREGIDAEHWRVVGGRISRSSRIPEPGGSRIPDPNEPELERSRPEATDPIELDLSRCIK